MLEFEQQYLAALPLSEMYERSYMHRDTLTAVAATKGTDFLITASADGHLKFWKKQPRGVEFAKHFRAHLGPVTALAVSDDGALCASISTDKTAKVRGCGGGGACAACTAGRRVRRQVAVCPPRMPLYQRPHAPPCPPPRPPSRCLTWPRST